MGSVFLKILNMSITASWLILAVIISRLILKKAPKWVSCLLWGLVALRLILPFSFESILSLIPSAETIPQDIALSRHPEINSGIYFVNSSLNPIIKDHLTPSPESSVNPLQVVLGVAVIVWVLGIVVMLLYALISYIRLKKSVSASVRLENGVMACDDVKSPFILGIFWPKIYVPSSMNGDTLDYVISHENAHIRRKDHIWKPIGFLILSVYWFNPLCWVAYVLLCRDIEMACDERVIKDMGKEEIAAYSQALLDCSFPKKRITACPVAFGETGIKQRIKGVLSYKKPAFWIIILAVILSVVLVVCLMTNPFSPGKLDDKMKASMEAAILEKNGGERDDDTYTAVAYDVLGISKKENETTVYAKVTCEKFSCEAMVISLESGTYGPVAITFDTSSSSSPVYSVVEYWEPRDGRGFEDDIREKFPSSAQGKALDMKDSEKLHDRCYQSAAKYFESVTAYLMSMFGNYEESEFTAEISSLTEETAIVKPISGPDEIMRLGSISIPLEIILYTVKAPGDVIKVKYSGTVSDSLPAQIENIYSVTRVQNYMNYNLEDLKEKYPDYFGLNAENGLKICVWQMGDTGHVCALVPGGDTRTDFELASLKGTSIAEMKAILSTYDITKEDIEIYPFHNPLSSYMYFINDGYREQLRNALLGEGADVPYVNDINTCVAYANWSDSKLIFTECANADRITEGSGQNSETSDGASLPVFVFRTKEDLDTFKEKFGNIFTLDEGYDEIPSFNLISREYDERFFDYRSVIMAYVGASSGSFRFALQDIYYEGEYFRLDVTQTNAPESFTDNMAGWFVIVDVPNSVMSQFKEFDAQFVISLPVSDTVAGQDAAISSALRHLYASDVPDGLIHLQSYHVLSEKNSDGDIKEKTIYMMVYHMTYNSQREEVSGGLTPAAITFTIDEKGGYNLKDYFTPEEYSDSEDGYDYEEKIRAVFPANILNKALNADDYADELRNMNLDKLRTFFEKLGSGSNDESSEG